MKKILLLIAVALMTISYGAEAPTDSQTPPSECAHLSDQEQEFASQLSDLHQRVFCRHFSASERLRAITLASPELQSFTGKNSPITPDEAVEAVMKDARQDASQPNSIEKDTPNEDAEIPK